jgi:hypothetical protein
MLAGLAVWFSATLMFLNDGDNFGDFESLGFL